MVAAFSKLLNFLTGDQVDRTSPADILQGPVKSLITAGMRYALEKCWSLYLLAVCL